MLRADRRKVFDVVVSDEAEHSSTRREIVQLAAARGVRTRTVGATELRRIAVTEVPQGVVAFAAAVEPVALRTLSDRQGPTPFLVVLDGVTDPGNLGTILRTALGAGATGIVLPRHHAARLTPSAVKAAAGAVEHLRFALVSGVASALATLRESGIWCVGLDERGPVEIDDVDLFAEPVAVVLGAEGSGLAPLTRQRCDVLARIDLVGPLGSLNVAAAAAVTCFTVARRRSRSTMRP
jgi:23S rRNA (guanosine2251-2'-O)-methyltransferase